MLPTSRFDGQEICHNIGTKLSYLLFQYLVSKGWSHEMMISA